MTKKGKITVQHYLNKRVKPKSGFSFTDSESTKHFPEEYAVYVRVIVKRKVYNFSSTYYNFHPALKKMESYRYGYMPEEKINHALKYKAGKYHEAFAKEENAIKGVLEIQKPFENESFSMQNFTQALDAGSKIFSTILNEILMEWLSIIIENETPLLYKIIDWEKLEICELFNALQDLISGPFIKKDISDCSWYRYAEAMYSIKKTYFELASQKEREFDDSLRLYEWYLNDMESFFLDDKHALWSKFVNHEIKEEFIQRLNIGTAVYLREIIIE